MVSKATLVWTLLGCAVVPSAAYAASEMVGQPPIGSAQKAAEQANSKRFREQASKVRSTSKPARTVTAASAHQSGENGILSAFVYGLDGLHPELTTDRLPDRKMIRLANLNRRILYPRWELFERSKTGTERTLATGKVRDHPLGPTTMVDFDVEFPNDIPRINTGPTAKEYFVRVRGNVVQEAGLRFRGSQTSYSREFRVTHLPADQQANAQTPSAPTPSRNASGSAQRDPYTCNLDPHAKPGTMYARKVMLRLAGLTAHALANPGGEDRVYIQVFTRGPGPATAQDNRMPFDDGAFAVNAGDRLDDDAQAWVLVDDQTSGQTSDRRVANAQLAHGQSLALDIWIREKSDVGMRDLNVSANGGYAAIENSAESAGPIGSIIEQAAGLPNLARDFAMPNADGDDLLGLYRVVVRNDCGSVRAVWLAPERITTNVAHRQSRFPADTSFAHGSARLGVFHSKAAYPNPSYYEASVSGFDFGAYQVVDGKSDRVMLRTERPGGYRYDWTWSLEVAL